MTKSEQCELAAQIKGKINDYEGDDADGVVKGLMWTLCLIEHDKAYADQRIKLAKQEKRIEGRDCC